MTFDPEFNAAVRHICRHTFPQGFGWAPDAPDTMEDLAALFYGTGKMVVTDKWVPEDHPQFEDAYTYRAFRAWHDWVHLVGNFGFTLEGECRATAFHHAQLTALYGEEKSKRWLATLTDELVVNNFGECAFCEG